MQQVTEQLYRCRDVAETLALSQGMVRKLIRTQKIQAVKIGKSVRVSSREIARLCGAPASAPAAQPGTNRS